MGSLVEVIAKALVTKPDEVNVTEEMKKMTKVMANPDSRKARSMMRNLGF